MIKIFPLTGFQAASPGGPTGDRANAVIPPRDRRFALRLLLAGVVCVGMGQTVIFSVLPPLARRLGFSEFQIALIFALSATLWSVCSPIWGRRSDYVGRKPMILLGLTGFALSITAFAAMLQLGLAGFVGGFGLYALIVSARSIYGLIGSANPAAAQAYIADRAPPEQRAAALSTFTAAFGIGAMLGPSIGGFAARFGVLAPLYFVGGFAAVMVVLIWRFLPERHAPLARNVGRTLSLRDPRLRPFLLCALGVGFVNATPIQTTAFFVMDALHVSPAAAPRAAGLALTAAAAASLFAQIVVVQRFRPPPGVLLVLGPLAAAIGHCLIAASRDVATLALGLGFSGLGVGMAIPGYAAGASLAVGADEQGAAAGLANSVGTVGFVLAPFVGFAVYRLAPQATFLLTAATSVALLAFAATHPAIRALRRKT